MGTVTVKSSYIVCFLLIVLVAAGCVVLFVFDPAQHAFYPGCALYKITGSYCPGCGGLRATHQLLHGRIFAAFHFNPLFVAALPILLWAFASGIRRRFERKPFSPPIKPNWLWSGGALLILFGILRNLPFAACSW